MDQLFPLGKQGCISYIHLAVRDATDLQEEREDAATKTHTALEDEKKKLEDELEKQQKDHEGAVVRAN